MKEKLQSVTQALKTVGTATGDGIVNGCLFVPRWCAKKTKEFKEHREFLEELDEAAADMAAELRKFNSLIEVRNSVRTLKRHYLLMERVEKEMSNV